MYLQYILTNKPYKNCKNPESGMHKAIFVHLKASIKELLFFLSLSISFGKFCLLIPGSNMTDINLSLNLSLKLLISGSVCGEAVLQFALAACTSQAPWLLFLFSSQPPNPTPVWHQKYRDLVSIILLHDIPVGWCRGILLWNWNRVVSTELDAAERDSQEELVHSVPISPRPSFPKQNFG